MISTTALRALSTFAIAIFVGGCGGNTDDSGGAGGASSSSGGSRAAAPANPPPASSSPAPTYRAWAQSGAIEHLLVVKADFANDTCIRVHLVAPFGPATERFTKVSVPPDWNIQNLARTSGASTCLTNEWGGPPEEAFAAEGTIHGVGRFPDSYYPCVIDVDLRLSFASGAEGFSAEALVVEGCHSPKR